MKKIVWVTFGLLFLLSGLSLSASAGGAPLGTRILVSNELGLDEVNAAVAYNPDRQEYLVVWSNDRPGNDDIRARRIAGDGRLLGPRFYVSAGAGADRHFPDVAYDSLHQEYLVVWQHEDHASSTMQIKGQRVSDTGTLIGGTFTIWTGGWSNRAPAVAYASTAHQYLVVWSSDTGGLMHIMGRTVTPAGMGSMFYVYKDTVGSLHELPDLAYNRARNEFLVAWDEFTAGWMNIYGVRVKMSGGPGVLGAPFRISTGTSGNMVRPTVAALPNPPGVGQYLVAWEDVSSPSNKDLFVQYVDGMGNVPPSVTVLANSPWSEHSPALAASESKDAFLATWTWVPVITPPAMMQVQGIFIPRQGSWGPNSTLIGGGQVFYSAVAAGPNGDFLVVFDDNETSGVSERGIYARLWGDRLYLPITMR